MCGRGRAQSTHPTGNRHTDPDRPVRSGGSAVVGLRVGGWVGHGLGPFWGLAPCPSDGGRHDRQRGKGTARAEGRGQGKAKRGGQGTGKGERTPGEARHTTNTLHLPHVRCPVVYKWKLWLWLWVKEGAIAAGDPMSSHILPAPPLRGLFLCAVRK